MDKALISPTCCVIICLSASLILFGVGQGSAQSSADRDVTITWHGETFINQAGYRIYYDIDSGKPYNCPAIYRALNHVSPDPFIEVRSEVTEYALEDLDSYEDYFIVVTAHNTNGEESPYSREICVLGLNNPDLVDPDYIYDRGWAVIGGDYFHKGLKFVYHSSDPTPTLGPSSGIPEDLSQFFPTVTKVSMPLNLETSGITPFSTPVKVFIPCPGYTDVSRLNVYYYDDAQKEWFLASDADEPDVVQDDAKDWMDTLAREPRQNHNGAIAIKVVKFSGAQAGVVQPPSSTRAPDGTAGAGGGGGCFISTVNGNEKCQSPNAK